jgi:hypothetical protein
VNNKRQQRIATCHEYDPWAVIFSLSFEYHFKSEVMQGKERAYQISYDLKLTSRSDRPKIDRNRTYFLQYYYGVTKCKIPLFRREKELINISDVHGRFSDNISSSNKRQENMNDPIVMLPSYSSSVTLYRFFLIHHTHRLQC